MTAVLPAIAALGVIAFTARFPHGVPAADVNGDPRDVRELVYTRMPELKNSQLDRVEVVGAPLPFHMSFAWAARLSSLDGVWYPPRRFIELLGALDGRELSPTTCVFELTRSRPTFELLQQLYNVRAVVGRDAQGWKIQELPETPGPAWFPTTLSTLGAPADLGIVLRAPGASPATLIRTTAYLLARDHVQPTLAPECAQASVEAAGTDALGQRAELEIRSPADCVLIVATNYVTTFRATVTVDGQERAAQVLPVDIALTAIQVPRGATRVTLAPSVEPPAWTMIAMLAGLVALLAVIVVIVRQRES
jgi:hypothetical protein